MIQVDPPLLGTRFEQDLKELRGISKKLPECFPKQLHHSTFSPVVCESSDFFHILINTCYYLFNSNHHSGCEVVSLCGLDLRFSDDCFFMLLIVLNFDEVQFLNLFFYKIMPFECVESKKLPPNLQSQRFYTMLFLEVLKFQVLHLVL